MTDVPPLRSRVVAGLVGATVPAMVFGKAGVAVPVLLAFLLAVPDLMQKSMWRALGRRANTPLGWAVVATAVLWLPGGVLLSIRPELSFEAWARTWIFVGIASLFWNIDFARREGLQALALRAFVVATAVALALSAIGFAVPPFLSLIHAKGWTASDPGLILKQFASAAMLMIPVALWVALQMRGKWRLVAAIEGVGLFWLLVATGSRSSMAGLLAMLVVIGGVVVLRRRSRRAVIGVCAAVVLATGAVFGWMYTIPRSSAWSPALIHRLNLEVPVWLIDLPRQEIWAFTWKKVLESPWIGHGINAVNYLPGADKPAPGMGGMAYIPGHPHNWALEVLAETGIIGFIPLAAAAWILFFRLLLMYRRTRDPAYLAAVCVHLGYWVSGLFNFSFWSAWWQVSYVMLLALTYPATHRHPGSQQPSLEEEGKSVRDGLLARAH